MPSFFISDGTSSKSDGTSIILMAHPLNLNLKTTKRSRQKILLLAAAQLDLKQKSSLEDSSFFFDDALSDLGDFDFFDLTIDLKRRS